MYHTFYHTYFCQQYDEVFCIFFKLYSLELSCYIVIIIMIHSVSITFICAMCSIQDHVLSFNEASSPVDEALLEGHLGVTRELLLFQTAQKKFGIGSC